MSIERLARLRLATGPDGYIKIEADGYHVATVSRGMNDRSAIARRIVDLWNSAIDNSDDHSIEE